METSNRRVVVSRFLAACLIAVLVLGYIIAVITGALPKTRQLESTHLSLLLVAFVVCVVLLRPKSLDRLTKFEGLGFKVELLQQLQERQARQAEEFYRLDLIVPLLFRDGERRHLSHLLRGTTKAYHGGSVTRDELRRLRTIGLLTSLPNRHVTDLHSDTEFDLADWVQLTTLGRYWAERLEKIGQAGTELSETATVQAPNPVL